MVFFDVLTFEGVNNFWFDGDQLNTRSNLKMAIGPIQNFPVREFFEVEMIINNAPLTYVYPNTIETCLAHNHLLFGT